MRADTELEFYQWLASLDDKEFVVTVSSFGYIPQPDIEDASQFRQRAVDTLTRTVREMTQARIDD